MSDKVCQACGLRAVFGRQCTSCGIRQVDDTRGTDEIERLAAHFTEMFEREVGMPLPIIVREVHLKSALVNAYAKGAEIGAEYALRAPPNEGGDT